MIPGRIFATLAYSLSTMSHSIDYPEHVNSVPELLNATFYELTGNFLFSPCLPWLQNPLKDPCSYLLRRRLRQIPPNLKEQLPFILRPPSAMQRAQSPRLHPSAQLRNPLRASRQVLQTSQNFPRSTASFEEETAMALLSHNHQCYRQPRKLGRRGQQKMRRS